MTALIWRRDYFETTHDCILAITKNGKRSFLPLIGRIQALIDVIGKNLLWILVNIDEVSGRRNAHLIHYIWNI